MSESPALFDEIRSQIDAYPLDDRDSVTWRAAVRSSLRLILGWDDVQIQYESWMAIHLDPPGRDVRLGTASTLQSLTRTGSDDPDVFIGYGVSLQDAAVHIVKKILACHFIGCSPSATMGDRSADTCHGGAYLHLENQPSGPYPARNFVVPRYFLNLFDAGHLHDRVGAALIPAASGFCMLWGSHFSIHEQPSLLVEMNATMATFSPSGVVLFPYIEPKPRFKVGDHCPECGGVWMERALFNSTFVGCLC